MKSAAEKSSATSTTVTQPAQQPFIARAGRGDFLAPTHVVAPAVQMKMEVNKPGDKFEQEADKMADNVIRMPTPPVRAKEGKLPRPGQDRLQKKDEEKIQKAALPEEKVQKKDEDKIQKAGLPEEKIQKAGLPEEKVQKAALPEEKVQKAGLPEEKVQKKEDDKLQKAQAPEEKLQRKGSDGAPAVGGDVQSAIRGKTAGGQPLSADVRGQMESGFDADFGNVRIHSDPQSASLSNQLSARAFTYQNHIFFSRDQYQPGTSEGKKLLAHELTHTIQQGHAVQRSPQVTTTTTPPPVQRLGVQDALDKFADWAYNIPGFRLLTLVLGFNPVNMRSTDYSAANLLRALIELMPGGHFITQALDNHGVINKAAAWVEQKLEVLGDIGGDIASALREFLDSLSWSDIFDLDGVWERAKRIFTEPIGRLISFGGEVVVELLKMVKDAILKPLAAMAQGTRGYDLLRVLLGEDPISGEPYPPTAENLLGGFMKFIGQEEIWENIKKGNAIARAYAWFQGALSGLMAIVRSIPQRIVDTINSLTFQDIITVAGAFGKIVGAFVSIAGDFLSWGLSTIWNLLEIIFDVVKPGLMGYIKKTGAALKSILQNPMPFLGNLVRAGKLGFTNFADRFVGHLKAGLIDWLTGSLEGVYIPQALTLPELGKFALSVLGITWMQIRGKIVVALGPNGERIMQGLELAFDIVKALVTGGTAAAWELIKDKLTDLKDQVISGIISFVADTIVKKAIPKIIAMFIPGAGFIPAIISIYDTIMVFVEKISKIIQVVTAFVDSIVAIAGGNIGAAANRVERVLAGLLSLAISFLAGFLGLRKVTDKIKEVIQKVRTTVDKAIDAAITWIVTKAKALFARLFSKDKPDDRTEEQKTRDKRAAIAEAERLVPPTGFDEHVTRQKLGPIKSRYRLLTLNLHIDSKTDQQETVHFSASASEDLAGQTLTTRPSDGESLDSLSLTRPSWIKTKDRDVRVEIMQRHMAASTVRGSVPRELFNADGTFKARGQWARRHILSSYDMKHHYEAALIKPHKTVKTGGDALAARGFKPASEDKTAIQPAAQSLLEKFHNDVSNLWVGDTRENSRLQENVDAAPSMYEATGNLRVTALEQHIQAMASTYGIPGPVAVTASNRENLPINTQYQVVGSGAPAVQTKMEVNQPGDKFEREADKTAEKVARMPAPPAPGKEEKLQRQPEEKLQREGSDGAPAVSSNMQSAIRSQTAGGEPLSADVRGHMEPRFNADFNNVRVHNDSESASLNSQLGARAFTYQNHIFFSRDQYQPGTSDGKQLLAHELTHTIQQGHAVQRQTEISPSVQSDHSAPAIQQAPARAGASAPASSEVVNISSSIFSPSQKVKDEIEASRSKGLDVRVAVKGLTAEGRVKIKADRAKNYDSVGKGSMPLLNPWTQQLGGMHINFKVNNSEIKGGYASFKPEAGDQNDWLQALQKNSSLLGGLGLKIGHLPTVKNTFDGGKLTLGVTNLKVELGGFLDALFNVSVEDMGKPKIDATTEVNIKGAVKGQLKLDNSAGPLAGQLSLGVDYKSFSGFAIVKYNADGSIDINGKGAYNADKLSGEIHFVSTDLETANRFTKDAIAAAGGKENIQDAGPPSPVPAPKAGQKKRALAATGQLAFHLTEWFAGTVHVIVDGKGAVTVIGRIAPPAEIRLFDQKDWDKELIKFEAKAYYGIPVVGDLNLFASISLHAIAKLGPAKIYNIEILGTYSTDPEIQKNIQVSGSINISAYGGLKLNAEGGVGVEILDHDLKFGIAIHVDAGVKAYADARPTIGYRDPGVFYISGTLELVAQPVLGLGGEFFIALETPWWSPLSDDRWNWPLFENEWPLGDPMGISASVKDYELGSKKVPEIELKKPEFDPSKFMTSMVDKTLPGKSGAAGASQGAFKEDGTVQKPVVPPKKPAPKPIEAKPPRKGTSPRGGKSASPGAGAASDRQSGKMLQSVAKPLAVLKAREALTRAELNQELAKIKAQIGAVEFSVALKGEKWLVIPRAGGRTAKGVEVRAKDIGQQDRDGKPEQRTEAESERDKLAAIAEAERLVPSTDFDETATRQKLGPIKSRYRLLSLNLHIDSKTDQQEIVHFSASASRERSGRRLTTKPSDGPSLDSLSLKRPSWIKTKDRDVRVEIMQRHMAASAVRGSVPRDLFNADGTFKARGQWARRHVLSSYDMKHHYETALIKPHKTVKTGGDALAARGFKPASEGKNAIQPAAQSLLEKFHNDVSNLWVGETRENSRLQENVDAAPSMYEATGNLRVSALEQHIQAMASTYGIPGPVAVTASNRENLPINTQYQVVG